MKKYQLLFFLILNSYVAISQEITVFGTVTESEDGNILPRALVMVKGTHRGVMTDSKGQYTIAVKLGATLMFSYSGYNNLEILVSRKIHDVTLIFDPTDMDPLYHIGYGTKRKKVFTGIISKIEGNKFSDLPIPSFEAGMTGLVSGVQVVQASGAAGSFSNIKIRGLNTIMAGSDPLYIIDGMPVSQTQMKTIGEEITSIAGNNPNPLSLINPSDIESIDIIKDGASTAIYGVRAANGVIIINTKRGIEGKIQFEFNYKTSLSKPVRNDNFINTKQYIGLYQEALFNDSVFYGINGKNPSFLPGGIYENDALENNNDWINKLTRTGFCQTADFSFRQGDKNFKSFGSISYSTQESYLKNNSFDRLTGRYNFDYNFLGQLTIGGSSLFIKGLNKYVPIENNSGIGAASNYGLPYFPVYSDSLNTKYFEFPDKKIINPVQEIENRTLQTNEYRALTSIFADYNYKPNLNFRIDAGGDFSNRDFEDYKNKNLLNLPEGTREQENEINVNISGRTTYLYSISRERKLILTAGIETFKFFRYSKRTRAFGIDKPISQNPTFPDTCISILNEDISVCLKNPFNETLPKQEFSYLSGFGNFNYTYLDKYFFTLILRTDKSSRFGINNQIGLFSGLSFSWLLKEQNLFKNLEFVNHLKLKSGIGKTGNAEIPTYKQFGISKIDSINTYNHQKQIFQVGLENPDLQWESTYSFDLGIEFTILKNNIEGELNFYYKLTDKLLLDYNTVPSSEGFHVWVNDGLMSNRGIDFQIKTKNHTGIFNWFTEFNISYNENKINRISEEMNAVKQAYPISPYFTDIYRSIDNSNGTFIFDRTDYPYFKGNSYPLFFGGLNNYFSFGGFESSFLFNFSLGNYVYNQNEIYQITMSGFDSPHNLSKKILERWTKPGEKKEIPKVSIMDGKINNLIISDKFIHDASFVRLKNFVLAYNVPIILNKLKVKSVKISFIITNVFTLQTYKEIDPEFCVSGNNYLTKNILSSSYSFTPWQTRTYMFGLKMGF